MEVVIKTETNRRDRKRIAQVRYLANKFKHQEVAPDVFKGEYITYYYSVGHHCLVVKRGNQRKYNYHYNDFEDLIQAQNHNGPKPKRIKTSNNGGIV